MKKLIVLITAIIMTASLCACGNTERTPQVYELSTVTVDATCLTEGYTEHVYSDGYVARDTFTARTAHRYVDVTFGTEEHVKRKICQECGKEQLTYEQDVISTEVVVDHNRPRPVFTGADVMAVAMILEETADEAIRAIRVAESHGARGFMIYVTTLLDAYKTREHLERIFHCTDLPILAIAYSSQSADWMADLLKLSVECGAAAVDLQGFMWSPVDVRSEQDTYRSYWESKGFSMSFVSSHPAEVCLNPTVLARQKVFIDEIQAMGAEVLLSMHCSVALNAEQTVDLARFVEAQGVDVIKIVLGGSSKATVIEHLKATMTLSETLSCKFSVHGQSTLSRMMCPMFGSYIAFCVDEYTQFETNIQIDLDTMIGILDSPEMQGAV